MNSSKIDLTASEISFLWNTYQVQSMNKCLLTYFDGIAEDGEVKKVNQLNLTASAKYLEQIQLIFKEANMPLPVAFSDEDLTNTEEKLYTDPFILFYQWFIAKGNLNFASIAINTIAREDVFSFFEEYTREALSLLDTSRKLLLEKGLWVRSPYIPTPDAVEFIKKDSFLHGWFGDTSPLTGNEIAGVFYNILTNTVGMALMDSFIRVTNSDELKNYFSDGKKISQKHIETLSNVLKKEEIAVPSTWNAGITPSTTAPFSEKLMLNLVTFLNSQGMSNYGVAFSTSMRRDVGATYTKMIAEVAKFAEEGVTKLIEKGWMEAPPRAPKKA